MRSDAIRSGPRPAGGSTVSGYLVDEWTPQVLRYANEFQTPMLAAISSLPTLAQVRQPTARSHRATPPRHPTAPPHRVLSEP